MQGISLFESVNIEDDLVQTLNGNVGLPLELPVSVTLSTTSLPSLVPSSITTTMAMSQDSAADSSSNMHQSPATDTNSLVSNSMLDASVPSYIPTTSYYPTSTPTAAYYFPGHHAPPYQHDIGSEVPQQQQHTYHAPDPYMHETNTSMPPPTIPYEQYYYPPFFQNLPQINQQSTPVYPIQQQFTYPVPQEYYQSEGN